jgi:phosphate transport system permease protein
MENSKMSHKILASLIKASGILIIAIVAYILFTILQRGLFLNGKFIFNPSQIFDTSETGMMYALFNTLQMTTVAVLIGFPIGLGTAIYLVEYGIKNKNAKQLVDFSISTLSGIPSIIYGIFGLLVFGVYFKLGLSFLTGALTMALMMIPTAITSVREELKAVPPTYREASFGLGANKTQTIFKVILPSAMRGIINSFLLSVSRIIGESAALLVTINTASRTLPLFIYYLRGNETISLDEFYALMGQAALMLTLLIVFIVLVTQKIEKRKRG